MFRLCSVTTAVMFLLACPTRGVAEAECLGADDEEWRHCGELNVPRSAPAAVLLRDGRVLISGGWGLEGFNAPGSDGHYLQAAEVFDPGAGAWTETAPMRKSRLCHTLTLLPDGRVLAAGGYSHTGPFSGATSTAELFDPADGTWASAPNMELARACHTATALPDGRVLIAGGPSAELFDPACDCWSRAGTLTTDRTRHVATLDGDWVMLVGGQDDEGNPVMDSDVFNSETNLWAPAHQGTLRVDHQIVTLSSGTHWITGGLDLGLRRTTGATFEVPGFGHANALEQPRMDFALAARGAGAIVIGGTTDGGRVVATTELFDETRGVWSTGPSLARARTRHAAVALRDGRVLVAGGENRQRSE